MNHIVIYMKVGLIIMELKKHYVEKQNGEIHSPQKDSLSFKWHKNHPER